MSSEFQNLARFLCLHPSGPVEAKKDPFQTRTRFRSPPPQAAAAPTELDGQRERTIGFVNEGLEVWPGHVSCLHFSGMNDLLCAII
jgi:hypothetical protein